jgi:transcriptional regulator with XRE-family HTH domain
LAKNWSQERLAELLETSAMTVRRWEHDAATPQIRFRERLCELLQCSSEDLFGASHSVPTNDLAHGRLWAIPFHRNPGFTGRERLVAQLCGRPPTEQITDPTRLVALTSQGGIGNTQIAGECADRRMRDYGAVLWLNAETLETLTASIQQIAEELALPDHPAADQRSLLAAMRCWLSTREGCILIVDNVEDHALPSSILPKTR